jgi:hypothetical protein
MKPKTSADREQKMYEVKMFENIHGTWSVMKINKITNSAQNVLEFGNKNEAIACYVENGGK